MCAALLALLLVHLRSYPTEISIGYYLLLLQRCVGTVSLEEGLQGLEGQKGLLGFWLYFDTLDKPFS